MALSYGRCRLVRRHVAPFQHMDYLLPDTGFAVDAPSSARGQRRLCVARDVGDPLCQHAQLERLDQHLRIGIETPVFDQAGFGVARDE